MATLDRHIFPGELSPDGAIRPVRGALTVAVCAKEKMNRSAVDVRLHMIPLSNAEKDDFDPRRMTAFCHSVKKLRIGFVFFRCIPERQA